MQMFPLPPKPKGVIAPEFLNVLKKDDFADDSTDDETTSLLNPRNEDSPIGGKELPPAKYWPLDY